MSRTYYDVLGVRASASDAEIRDAYRRLVRVHHPDTAGGDTNRMADLNAAWHALSEPGRRAMYDATLRPQRTTFSAASAGSSSQIRDEDDRPYVTHAASGHVRRWPAGALMLIALFAAIFVFTAYAANFNDDLAPPLTSPPFLSSGMCVSLQGGRTVEVSCEQTHYGRVVAVINRTERCPVSTEGYFSNDGASYVCVTRSTS